MGETLNTELKNMLIDALDLEEITPDDIDDDAPLFGEGLGLDSIDALELGLALQKRYNIVFSTKKEELRKHFASINALAELVRLYHADH